MSCESTTANEGPIMEQLGGDRAMYRCPECGYSVIDRPDKTLCCEACARIEREIINPSDKAYVDISDREAACVAVAAILGSAYGIDGEDGMPVFILAATEAVDGWWREQFGHGIDAHGVSSERIARALRSMRLAGQRSSMNDFVGRAHAAADEIEKQEACNG